MCIRYSIPFSFLPPPPPSNFSPPNHVFGSPLFSFCCRALGTPPPITLAATCGAPPSFIPPPPKATGGCRTSLPSPSPFSFFSPFFLKIAQSLSLIFSFVCSPPFSSFLVFRLLNSTSLNLLEYSTTWGEGYTPLL